MKIKSTILDFFLPKEERMGEREKRYMAKADPEIKNKDYLTDESAPILWYAVQGDIIDQVTIITNEILPELMVRRTLRTAEIIWIPSQVKKETTRFRENLITILDCTTSASSSTHTTPPPSGCVSPPIGLVGARKI